MDTGSDEENCTAPENVLPTKSGKLYEAAYRSFMEWRDRKEIDSFSEEVLLDYFGDLAEKYKSTSLWTQYSMLRSTLEIHHDIKLESYRNLRALLKSKSNGYKAKKAKAFTPEEINAFIKYANDRKYLATKVALIMGIMGACRCNEMKEMKIGDLQDLTTAMLVNVPKTNTKAARRFTIAGDFYHILKKYIALRPSKIECSSLFLNYQNGKCTTQKVGINKFAAMGKQIATFLKLPNPEMYTGHSFRSSSATLLVDERKNKMDIVQNNFQPIQTTCFTKPANENLTMNVNTPTVNLTNCENFTIHIHTNSVRSSSATLVVNESMKNKMDTTQKNFQSVQNTCFTKPANENLVMDITTAALNLTNCDTFTIHIHTSSVVPLKNSSAK